jgi:hypothetical protein
MKTSPHQLQLHAKVNRLQIDDQMYDCVFTVVLAPVPPPKSVAADSGAFNFNISLNLYDIQEVYAWMEFARHYNTYTEKVKKKHISLYGRCFYKTLFLNDYYIISSSHN